MNVNKHFAKDTIRKLCWSLKGQSSTPTFSPMIAGLEPTHKKLVNKWNEQFEVNSRVERLKFVHVGKCGGTSIVHKFLQKKIIIQEFHNERPSLNEPDWLFMWIRHPLKRFVSAFNHSKELIEIDVNKYVEHPPTLYNSQAPMKILTKMEKGWAFNYEYDNLVKEFESANALAESLSSSNRKLRGKANRLMQSRVEHIYKGLGWYLDNGLSIEKNHNRILFVGHLEKMEECFETLLERIGVDANEFGKVGHIRNTQSILEKKLSPKGEFNLFNFYQHTDYAALASLKKWGLVDNDVVDSYYPTRGK